MTASPDTATRSFLALPFAGSAVLLLAAAVGLQPAITWLTARFSKAPIPLRRPLAEFDASRLPSFRPAAGNGSFQAGFGHSRLDNLGADDVLRLVLEPKADGGAGREDADVMLFVTYYSNPRDQVPHTPEVCYRQGGATVRSIESVTVKVPELGPEHAHVDARLLDLVPVVVVDGVARSIDPETDPSRQALAYVLVCNGEFYGDRERVRWAIGMPGEPYVYFSKIEVVTNYGAGTELHDAVERCRAALGESLSILINDHFPTKAQVRGFEAHAARGAGPSRPPPAREGR